MGTAIKAFDADAFDTVPFDALVFDQLDPPWPPRSWDETNPAPGVRELLLSTEDPHPLAAAVCASCDGLEELVFPDDPEGDVLCRECRSPLTSLDYPELYCELGGEG